MSTGNRARVFRYDGWTWQPGDDGGELSCSYSLDDRTFTERIHFPGVAAEPGPLGRAALRLVFLLAGISYYKAGAPPVVDLGGTATTPREREFLRRYYVEGLGEFALKAGLLTELQDLELVGPERAVEPVRVPAEFAAAGPLVPFGGGIDSIVVVEELRREGHGEGMALFVASRAAARFEAIETAAAVTGLPVRRADRELDPQILRSAELGFLNGHVPITGILSATAVAAAVLSGRSSVVMSNEWSASSGTTTVGGIDVNHQWSKSFEFESLFRGVLAETLEGFEYWSALRPYSELWVAERFAKLERYHLAFRSCNRAFYADPARRWTTWCGECDKCVFIDLILSPYLSAERLREIFRGGEPLGKPELIGSFLSLLGDPARTKPFECVGDVDECRMAVALASARPDRRDSPVLPVLLEHVNSGAPLPPAEDLLRPLSASFVPGLR